MRRMRDSLCASAQKPMNLLLYRPDTYPEPTSKGLRDVDQLVGQPDTPGITGIRVVKLNPEFPDCVRCFDRPYGG